MFDVLKNTYGRSPPCKVCKKGAVHRSRSIPSRTKPSLSTASQWSDRCAGLNMVQRCEVQLASGCVIEGPLKGCWQINRTNSQRVLCSAARSDVLFGVVVCAGVCTWKSESGCVHVEKGNRNREHTCDALCGGVRVTSFNTSGSISLQAYRTPCTNSNSVRAVPCGAVSMY